MPVLELSVGLSGPTYSLGPGDTREFSEYEAGRLVAAGFAVPVEDDSPPKTQRKPRKKVA